MAHGAPHAPPVAPHGGGRGACTHHTHTRNPPRPRPARLPAGFCHPNVFDNGQICLSLINDYGDWKPSVSLKQILQGIQEVRRLGPAAGGGDLRPRSETFEAPPRTVSGPRTHQCAAPSWHPPPPPARAQLLDTPYLKSPAQASGSAARALPQACGPQAAAHARRNAAQRANPSFPGRRPRPLQAHATNLYQTDRPAYLAAVKALAKRYAADKGGDQ